MIFTEAKICNYEHTLRKNIQREIRFKAAGPYMERKLLRFMIKSEDRVTFFIIICLLILSRNEYNYFNLILLILNIIKRK